MASDAKIVPSLERIAALVAIVVSCLAAGLHVLFGVSAGALWRDEVNSLELATVSTLSEMWNNLDYDSFPALFFVVLRLFAGVPSGVSDDALRLFGVVIGLAILAAVWWNSRQLRIGVPLISLALIGFNPMVIRYGDSIRAYGLGIVLILITIGALWKVVEAPTARRVAIASLAAVLSVQCLYYNSILLFAICMGGVAVTLRHRQWQRAAILLGVGAVAAISLLPYAPTIRRVRAWNFQFKAEIDFPFLWGKLAETLGSPVRLAVWLWVALLALALAAAVVLLARKAVDVESRARQDRALFACVTLVVGCAGYVCFLRVLSYVTQPWYYIVFVAFAATCIEAIFASVSAHRWQLGWRAGLALLVVGASILPAAGAVQIRQTNVDHIAERLKADAREGDLVVIHTWNYGITLQRYYDGPAALATIPPIEDLRFHRCDLAKREMMSAAPLEPVWAKMTETLQSGRTVWLVGGARFPPPGKQPLRVAPGRDGPRGWEGEGFYAAWSEQLGFFIQQHAAHLERLQVPIDRPVMHYENLPLTLIRGWRG